MMHDAMMHEILDQETFAPASSSYPSSLVWAAGARDSRSSTMDSCSVRNFGVAIVKLLAARKTASKVVDFGIGRASLHAFGCIREFAATAASHDLLHVSIVAMKVVKCDFQIECHCRCTFTDTYDLVWCKNCKLCTPI